MTVCYEGFGPEEYAFDVIIQLWKVEFLFFTLWQKRVDVPNVAGTEIDYFGTLWFNFEKLNSRICLNISICDICLGEIMCSGVV